MPDRTCAQLIIQASELILALVADRGVGPATEADQAWCAVRQSPAWSRQPLQVRVSGLVSHALTRIACAREGAPVAILAAAREDVWSAIALDPEQYAPRAILQAWSDDAERLWRTSRDILLAHPLYPMDTPDR